MQNDKINVPYTYRYQANEVGKENWLRAIRVSKDNLIALGAQGKVLILELGDL